MIEFIQRLQLRYQSVRQTVPSDSNFSHYCANAQKTLVLAEISLLKKHVSGSIQSSGELPLNLVIFGPTQVGKSTLVNCLLPEALAGISPLAGYTVHPQGFATSTETKDATWLETLFPDYKRVDQNNLDHTDLAAYALVEIASSGILANQKPTVIWDTPDFDSIDSQGYIDAVLRTIGLGDILVLVVSKEKYADQSVWDMLKLLAPLRQPLLVCINKLGEGEEQTLFRSFQNRYKSELPESKTPVLVSLPFVEADEKLNSDHIIQVLNTMISDYESQKNTEQPKKFIETYWQDWIQPVQDEIQDDLEWQSSLQRAVDSAMQSYRQEFLDHPDYYDTFQRAMAELLDLLEIPGFGEKLGKAREVITWPMRKLIGFGKSVLRSDSRSRVPGNKTRDKGYEEALLRQLVEQVIIELANENLQDQVQASGESHSNFWKQDFRQSLNQSRQNISEQFERQVSAYQSEFDHEIQEAAQALYLRLEEQPKLLNSLRAARVTTDAAAVVFALHSGGISLNDFILAPAMLSLSSMLAESSVGQYMNTVKAKLKTRQYETVQRLLFDHLQNELNRIRDQTSADSRFQITEQEIEELEGEFFG